jgi:hypothetical protein
MNPAISRPARTTMTMRSVIPLMTRILDHHDTTGNILTTPPSLYQTIQEPEGAALKEVRLRSSMPCSLESSRLPVACR